MTSTDITVINPATGELLTLNAATSDLGAYLADIREHEQLIREAKQLVTGELLARMDRDGLWTVHTEGGLTLKGGSPAPVVEYDELALRESLLELADQGVITVEAVDRAVEPVVSYKVRAVGVRALAKLGGRVADVIGSHARVVEKRRYVTVERS